MDIEPRPELASTADEFGAPSNRKPATVHDLTERRPRVDRAFVEGLGTDSHDSALVAAIVAMAGALDLEVVAEGVETTKQLKGLRTLRCKRAQSFYLARPLPTDAMARLVAQREHLPRLAREDERRLEGTK